MSWRKKRMWFWRGELRRLELLVLGLERRMYWMELAGGGVFGTCCCPFLVERERRNIWNVLVGTGSRQLKRWWWVETEYVVSDRRYIWRYLGIQLPIKCFASLMFLWLGPEICDLRVTLHVVGRPRMRRWGNNTNLIYYICYAGYHSLYIILTSRYLLLLFYDGNDEVCHVVLGIPSLYDMSPATAKDPWLILMCLAITG